MNIIVFKCPNSSLDYFDTVKKFIEKMMEQSIMTKLLMNARKRQSDNSGDWSDAMKKDFVNAPHWSIQNGYQFWQKVEDKRKGFNIA